MPLDVESLDLLTVADMLRAQFFGGMPDGFMEGKTACRDLLVATLNCSELESEQIVDTLIARGYLTFIGLEVGSAQGAWSLTEGH